MEGEPDVVTQQGQVWGLTAWAAIVAGLGGCLIAYGWSAPPAPASERAILVERGHRAVELAVLGGVIVTLAVLAGAGAVLAVLGMRQARRASQTVLGQGDGALVHVLPTWHGRSAVLKAELWPVSGDAPLGVVALGATDRRFDPTQPFRAWGSLAIDQPVALTSADGRQVVLPEGVLTAATRDDPGPVTATAAALLGWPGRSGPGVPRDLRAIDHAVDVTVARERRARTLLIPVGITLVTAFSPIPVPLVARLGIVMLAGLIELAALWPLTHIRSSVRTLVAPTTGDRALTIDVANALMVARQPPSRTAGGGR